MTASWKKSRINKVKTWTTPVMLYFSVFRSEHSANLTRVWGASCSRQGAGAATSGRDMNKPLFDNANLCTRAQHVTITSSEHIGRVSHSKVYEEYCLLGCDAVYSSGYSPLFLPCRTLNQGSYHQEANTCLNITHWRWREYIRRHGVIFHKMALFREVFVWFL
jgi:hypothetical protein